MPCPQVQLKHFEIASSRNFLKAAAFSAVMGEGGQEAGDKREEPLLCFVKMPYGVRPLPPSDFTL